MHSLGVVREFAPQIVGPGRASTGIDGWYAGRRCLKTVHLPRRWEQGPAHAIGDGQIRFDAPGILSVELVEVEAVFAPGRRARSDQVAGLVIVIVSHDIRDHSQQTEHGIVILRSRCRLSESPIGGIEVSAVGVGKAGRRHPVCGSLAQAEGMFVAETRIADKADVCPKLKRVRAAGPGKIIKELIYRDLRIVALGDALVQAVEQVPRLIRIAHDACALTRKCPAEVVNGRRAEDSRVAKGKPLAVVCDNLFRWGSWQERCLRVEYVLQAAPPEQGVIAVGSEVIIQSGDESIVIQADGGSETKARIIQTVADRAVIGYKLSGAEGLVEIAGVARVFDGRIDPNTQRIEVFQLRRR